MTLAIERQQRKSLTFTAILYWGEDVYVAECPEVGTASQGETIEEAIAPSLKSPTAIAYPSKIKTMRSLIQSNYLISPTANSIQNYQVYGTTDQLFFQE